MSRASFPVWIGNRENPIPSNSNPLLSLGTRGELIITHDRDRGRPIQLYAGRSSQNTTNNVTATLLDTGNVVVNSNGPAGLLWHMFDHPTDTLLPGMKLGVNLRTGRKWTLSSWSGENDPATGAYSLEWEPSSRNLLVRRRGAVIWRSRELKYYQDESGQSRAEFDNIDLGRDVYNFNFNFTSEVVSNEEEFVLFSVLPYPGSPQQVVSGWKVEDDGNIIDISRLLLIVRPANDAATGDQSAPGNAAVPSLALRVWIAFAFLAAVWNVIY